MKRNKVFHMVTVSKSIGLMKGQLEFLLEKGFNIGMISSPGKQLEELELKNKKAIPMEREINIFKDMKSLALLIKLFFKERPALLNTGTPKAGLLGIIAAFVTRVPNRIYTMRGLRLETTEGWKRKILWFTEKISCTLSTHIVCISPSLKDRILELKLANKNKIVVLANGSSNGINVSEYPEPNSQKEKIETMKKELNIRKSTFVLGFVGRITRDKGINELIEAFVNMKKEYQDIKLIILGRYENSDPIKESIQREIETNADIIYLGFVNNPITYFYLFDLLIFPTYREGFGNVSIQAQAAGTPVITSDATGAIDTVINKETGYIVRVGSVDSIVEKVLYLIRNKAFKNDMGIKARSRAINDFNSILIWRELDKFYRELLSKYE